MYIYIYYQDEVTFIAIILKNLKKRLIKMQLTLSIDI